MAAAGLVAPELELTDSNYAIQMPTFLARALYRIGAELPQPSTGPSPCIVPDYLAFLPNARHPTALVDQLDLLFCANQMTTGTRTLVINALNEHPAASTDLERVQSAIQFVVTSPDGAFQR